MPSEAEIKALKDELAAAVLFLHGNGWAPATSSNYSFRVPGESLFWISRSGIDKGAFGPEHLMLIDGQAKPVLQPGAKPSAETLLHLLLYEEAGAGAVLHTHSVSNTVLSLAHLHEGGIELSGYEMLKGIEGVTTHEARIFLPIFENSQDMQQLSVEVRKYRDSNPGMAGFLLAGHGLYAWGRTIADAKRHIEVLEFLMDCTIKRKLYGYTQHT